MSALLEVLLAYSRKGRDVMQLFEEFHLKNFVGCSFNAIFFILIPKKGGAKYIKNFRYVSVVDNLYKLLVKVLAHRLKRMVEKVVSND